MAKPIKITPVLRGDDALRFYRVLDTNKSKEVSSASVIARRDAATKFLSKLIRKK